MKIAWTDAGGVDSWLSFNDKKTFRVDLKPEYLDRLPDDIRSRVESGLDSYYYLAKVDVRAFVRGELVLAVECKSYTENAMLKRILVDFQLLKTLHPSVNCCLFQLESQLGGSYSNPLADPQFGSPRSHTLMSYFPSVDLNIITLLEGERHVNRPIHDPQHYKELRPKHLGHAIDALGRLLSPFV